MKYKYTVLVETEEEGGYHVSCPALPGCHSEGETIEEALTQIKEAIEVYLESLLAHGEPVPAESGILMTSTEVELDAQAAAHAA